MWEAEPPVPATSDKHANVASADGGRGLTLVQPDSCEKSLRACFALDAEVPPSRQPAKFGSRSPLVRVPRALLFSAALHLQGCMCFISLALRHICHLRCSIFDNGKNPPSRSCTLLSQSGFPHYTKEVHSHPKSHKQT